MTSKATVAHIFSTLSSTAAPWPACTDSYKAGSDYCEQIGKTSNALTAAENHHLFDDLLGICRLLEANNIIYYLAGGTMLGAIRHGTLISHDRDFDLDCLAEDESRIFQLAGKFEEMGYHLSHKTRNEALPKVDRAAVIEPVSGLRSCRCLKIVKNGVGIGDIYLFQRFADGIARRYDFDSGTYYNAKMSLPSWYYDQVETVSLYGEYFTTVRDPDKACEKIYGPDWRTPLKPGEFQAGRNRTSGAVLDSDIESLIEHALANGWNGDYSGFPAWPQPVAFTNTKSSRRWIRAHEPDLNPELESALKAARDESFRTGLLARIAVVRALRVSAAATAKASQKRKPGSALRRLRRRIRAALAKGFATWRG
jgi:hypothetical protein